MNISGNTSWSDESLHIIYKPWEIALCAFILTFGLVANVMLLIAQWKDPLRCFGTISTCFIQHIAIIDCLALLVSCPFLVIAVRTNSPFYVGSNHMKQLKPFALFCIVLINFGLTSFAVERFLSTTRPFFHKVHFTKQRVRVSFVIMWIFALICVVIDQCLYGTTKDVPFSSYIVETSVSLPCLTTTFSLYIACFISMKRQQREFKQTQMADITRNALNVKLSNEKRFLVTIFIVCSVTVIFWVPAFVMPLPLGIEENTSREFYRLFFTVIPCMATMHSSINPVIYNLRLPKYRKTFYKLYCCFCAHSGTQ